MCKTFEKSPKDTRAEQGTAISALFPRINFHPLLDVRRVCGANATAATRSTLPSNDVAGLD